MLFISISLVVPLSNYSVCYSFDNSECKSAEINQHEIIINNHEARIDLTDPTNVFIVETFEIQNNLSSPLLSCELWFNESFSINHIEEDNQVISNYEKNNSTNSILINFQIALDQNETKVIEFHYYLLDTVQLIENEYYEFFFRYFRSYYTMTEFFQVRLPQNSDIHEGNSSVLPFTDSPTWRGGSLFIEWIYTNLEPGSTNWLMIKFDEPPKKPPVWIFILGPLAGVACGIGGTVWFMKKRETKALKEIGKILLTENEKFILRLISENGGKISQKDLCIETEFTKSKISRNLVSLEKNELITREKWGRNYQIYITDLGRKVVE